MSGNRINSGPASFLSRYGKLLDGTCPYIGANGAKCTGLPVYRKLKTVAPMKWNYCPNERSHRFLTINPNIKEELLRELLANEEKFTSDVAVESESAVCAWVVQAKLIERKCRAIIWIFSPLDRTDIVYLSSPHNHPKVPSTKVSWKGKEVYREAIAAVIFGGNIPAAFDPAIANPQIKHSLIQEMKKVKNPCGLGIEGYTENGLAHITKSEVKFKFIDGEGLRAILVDGNKPQANTLGACLIPNSYFSTFFEHAYFILRDSTDPNLTNSLPDWISDKDSIPWLFPSINGLLSAIPEGLTPGDTNLNEIARSYTNQHTETTLSLLEAIERAYEMDLQIEAKLREMGNSCVLINHRNTKVHHDRINVAQRATHYRQALERSISILLSARWTSLFSDDDFGTLVEVKCVLRRFDQNENGVSLLGYCVLAQEMHVL
ncbi:hypothetical protein C8J57DRAFT_1467896 [Mycena rebaudengoi]|nr:hypothetical protein C8J57DRAFT_1467896 [Mycena rebaudengoi]